MAKPPTAKQASREAWNALGIVIPPKVPRQRLIVKDFNDLKEKYVAEYGYTIKIPQFDDIFHLTPTLLQTDKEIKARKRQQLQQILASPTPEWTQPYTTLMTWIDNIQDHSSLLFPTFKMLLRWSPKIFLRAVPVMGWILLGFDILQWTNQYMRAPWKGMRAKRAHCEKVKGDPFSKNAQKERAYRIKTYNPGFSDIIQVAQTTDQWTGFGISLGAVMGFAFDSISGLARYALGQKVSISPDLPKVNLYELTAAKTLKAAAGINSAGQVFSEELHFWSMISFASAVQILGGYVDEADFLDDIETPQDLLIEAPQETQQSTIEVIREAGLDPEKGRLLPHFLVPSVPLSEWQPWQNEQTQKNILAYYFRHSHDQYGFVASHVITDAIDTLVDLFEPNTPTIEEDTPAQRVVFTMLKAPLRPDQEITKDQSSHFGHWIDDFTEINGHTPTIKDIKHKLDAMQIAWTTSFPTTMEDRDKHLWPDPFDDSEFI